MATIVIKTGVLINRAKKGFSNENAKCTKQKENNTAKIKFVK